jgi:hypothetical protein
MRKLLLSMAAGAAMALAGISSALAQGQIIIVNGDGPNEGFNDPTPAAAIGGNAGTTLGQQRLNVFNFGADVWEAVLNPRVDVFVVARFNPLGAGVLGAAGTTFVFSDFPGAEYPGMLYHSALSDHLAGVDLNPGFADIGATFSSDTAFYLGFDNNDESVPGNVDLLPVVLHELGHGLGFANFVDDETGELFLDTPDIYSQYTLDVTTNKKWNEMTDAERMASSINIRKVSWDGVNVKKDVPKVLERGEPFVGVRRPASLGRFMFGPAAFGPELTPAGVRGEVVLGDDGVAPGSDGCTALTNPVAGKIVLLDRGTCAFTVKVLNAQNAGAKAVLIADNVLLLPPPGLGGFDAAINIVSGRISLTDGNAVKAALAAGAVNVEIDRDTSIRSGTDRVKGLMMVASFNPVQPGSSISHYEPIAIPNQLMEPSINANLTSSVTPPEDLTTSLFTDIGWFSDADGVPDGTDQCIGSDQRATAFIGACDTQTDNDLFASGCTIADELFNCEADFGNHPLKYLACVTLRTEKWARDRVISRQNQVRILSCAIKGLH